MAADSSSDYFRTEFGKGISFGIENNNFQVKLGGLLQIDEVLHNTNNTLINENSGIRRGRVTLGMQFYRDWDLRVTYDLTADHTDIRGFQLFFLRYKGFRRTQFRIGNLQELVGLDWLTSSRNTVFMERAQITSLIPTIHLGFVANIWGDFWTLSSGIFGARPIDGISTENEWGVSSRFTYTPIRNSKTVLHFGVSGAYRELDENASNSSINIRDFNAENARFSSVGRVRNYNEIIATEVAARKEALSMQFEYLRTFRNQRDEIIQSSDFDSWYIQASWLLTGEMRRYSKRNGTFGQVNPNNKFTFNGGTGAWEIAARYSELNRVTGPRELGKGESNITFGLNWYPFSHIRIMANYIRVHSDLSLTNTIAPKKEHANIFATRVQIEF